MDSPEVAAVEPNEHRTGLVLFGMLDLVVAIVYLIKALAIVLLAVSGANPAGTVRVSPGELPLAALLAFAPSAFFMTLGIGSILGRRWARSLSVAFSSLWLAFDAVTAAAILICLPRLIAATGEKPPLTAYGIAALVGIVLPGAYVLFYRSAGVKRSCEWLDPQERWTDRCPTAVLMSSMLLVIGAVLELGIGFSSTRQTIYFGHTLGEPARFAFFAAAVIQLAVAWNMIRRRRWSWVAAIALIVLHAVGNLLILRNFSFDRLERLAAARGRIRPRDETMLQALKSMHPSTALLLYFLAISVLALSIVIGAGKWFPMSPSAGIRDGGRGGV